MTGGTADRLGCTAARSTSLTGKVTEIPFCRGSANPFCMSPGPTFTGNDTDDVASCESDGIPSCTDAASFSSLFTTKSGEAGAEARDSGGCSETVTGAASPLVSGFVGGGTVASGTLSPTESGLVLSGWFLAELEVALVAPPTDVDLAPSCISCSCRSDSFCSETRLSCVFCSRRSDSFSSDTRSISCCCSHIFSSA